MEEIGLESALQYDPHEEETQSKQCLLPCQRWKVQIPVALDESNRGKIFQMFASSNMAIYAMEMTKLEVNDKLVLLGCSQLFRKNDVIIKYNVDQSSLNLPNFIVFHYYLE